MKDSGRTTQRNRVITLLRRHGTMRLSELKAHGVHATTLSRLVEEGTLYRPSRGLYELAGVELDLSHSLAQVAKRVPRGVIALMSALQLHDITQQLPRSVWIAIGSKERKPLLEYPPVRIVRFGENALSTGIETHVIDSVPVRVFDPAKSIVDCFRFRSTVGLDVALEALRMGWRSRKATADEIAEYAHNLRIWSVVRPYLETVVADEG